MKNRVLISALLVCFCYVVNAQDCFILENGYKINLTSLNYGSKVSLTKGWLKMKPEKKAELVNAFNTNVMNGTEPVASSSSYEMYIKDVMKGDPGKMLSGMVVSGVEYTFTALCKNNTNYFYRTIGPVYYVVSGDTVGAGFNGTQIIPNNLKVGDTLPTYEDMSTLVIGTRSYEDKQKVLDGYRKIETIERNTTHLNQQNLEWEKGDWTVTKYEEVWKEVDVKVLESISLNSHVIHGVNAVVDKSEDIILDGKTYKAYVIESELWTQAAFESNFAADNAKWLKLHQNFQNRLDKKVQKNLIKSKFLNEDGYYVTYQTEWFIHGMGVVKVVTYDSDGCISSISKWNDVK